ncbi:MAG TPA: ATP-dependent Clp protease proteolytic subunit [bacterium]|jgi:ATP-dependent Clp protease protease subunit|nr:ATP-dependent Clp protease proteolytic subunit [bacterium]
MEDEKKGNVLDDRGLIFLCGELDTGQASQLNRRIIEMNLQPKTDFIQLMISCPGGSVDAGFALIDLMQWSRLPVYTTGFGLVASMGLSVLMAGAPGHRVLTPRATLMSHRFWTLSGGNYSGLVARRKIEDLTHRRILDHYMECTKLKDAMEVEAQLLRDVDTWLTPKEAVELGVVDRVHERNVV